MRWLPRRRRGEHRDAPPSPGSAAERTQAAEQPPTEPATRRTAARPAGAAHWRRLPPLAPTMRRAPLTATATLGALAQDPTRPLLHPTALGRPLTRRRRDESMPVDAGADEGVAVEPAVGHVTGLATVLPEAPTEPDAPAPSPAPTHRRVPVSPISEPAAAAEPPPSAPRLTPRVVPSAGPRPNLLRAEGEYVGAPEPDAAPYASSAWLRMVESYRPPWANDPAAGAPPALPPIPEGGASWSSEAALPPPRPPKPARREGPGPQRRASLAESRRLGLGKPLRPSPPGESGPEFSPESGPRESDSQDTQTAGDPPTGSPASPIGPTELRHGRPERTEAPAATPPPETDGESDSQDTRTATDPPTDSAASPIELRHSRPERTEAPAAARPPETDRDAGADTAAAIGADADDEPKPKPRPRLGLGAPIDRPVRSFRDTSPNVPPAPARARSAPTRPDPAPSPQPTRATGEASDRPAQDPAETARPAPRRRAEPVYRFVPAERPARTATPPRPATPPAALPSTPPAAPPSPPAAAAAPAPPAAAPAPSATAPAVRPSAPTAPSARPLTHPRAQRRSDADRAEAEPRPQQPAPSPQQAQPTVPDPIPERVQGALWEPAHQVPAELLDAVRWAQGVDVSDVPIRRDPEVAEEARTLGARSFTRDAEVFLPPEHGSPQEPVARGLLAHELTHAAQQRALGSALPAEDSDAGRALEAQAVAAERWARGLGAPPAPAPAAYGGPATAPLGASWTAPWQAAPTRGVQRQSEDVAGMPEAADGSDPSEQSGAAPPPPAGTRVDHEMASARDRLLDLSRRRPLDLDDPDDIDELSVRIYQRIHRRLRRELLVERERAGRLGESGPFGAAR